MGADVTTALSISCPNQYEGRLLPSRAIKKHFYFKCLDLDLARKIAISHSVRLGIALFEMEGMGDGFAAISGMSVTASVVSDIGVANG